MITASEIKELQAAENGGGGPSFISKMSVPNGEFT